MVVRPTVAGCAASVLSLVLVWMSASPQAQGRGGGPTQVRGGPVGISANGRFLDLGLVVLDTQTNLMWEKKRVAVGGGTNVDDLHDAHHKYNWCVATGNSTGRFCGGNTTSWIGQVNAEGFAGFSDWRVPTRDELLRIVDCHGGPACINPIFGPTQVEFHWSATELDAFFAWYLNVFTGRAESEFKKFDFPVRAVRGGP